MRTANADDWLRFAGWVVVGVGAAFGAVSFPLALPLVGLIAWLLGRKNRALPGVWGSVSGVGLLLLFVAYVQRHGPGQYCHPIGTSQFPGTECGDYMNPLPWLVAGIVLVIIGVVGFIVRRRRVHHAPRPTN